MPTPSAEDYLERIYELIQEKGYARVIDIASSLQVRSSSVTKMLQRLGAESLVNYEKYRGITLTPRGEAIAKSVKNRHRKLEELLRMLGVGERSIARDVEGVEHHVSPETLACFQDLVSFFQAHPKTLAAFLKHRRARRCSPPADA
ncbi:MAG: transcriptional regulator MntR [Candidatus Bipolaricaulota bacterium]|nr:transcriptional regulator MntR [Candidatus Bipolaricaulota bacterium]MCS7274649.1 transcriptional regulator MntR [Candidatus Bipolaricaulota bacterium]MDW8110920.1 transcriptional regulator MntR [Candidatus Bipolaricaulota bacterium]MDW8329119.1 transcriptional regulator MntR [Candidatus Bipolaricaulota bacterium]